MSPAVLTHLRMVTSLRLSLNTIVVHISFCKEVLHAIVLPSAIHLITLLIHVPMVLWQNIVEWLLPIPIPMDIHTHNPCGLPTPMAFPSDNINFITILVLVPPTPQQHPSKYWSGPVQDLSFELMKIFRTRLLVFDVAEDWDCSSIWDWSFLDWSQDWTFKH